MPHNPPLDEPLWLARGLAAAFISYRFGLGLEYALKRYVPERPGAFWLNQARLLLEHHAQVENASADPSHEAVCKKPAKRSAKR